LKRSEDKAKLINPGFQITYRIIQDGKFKADVTCLRGDSFAKTIESGGELFIRDEIDETKYSTFPAGSYTFRPLQELAYDNGKIFEDTRTIYEKRDYYKANLASFNETQIRIINPHYYKVDISDDLYDLKMRLINRLIHQINMMQQEEAGVSQQFSHVVVDMLYDFIDGTMACANAEQAVAESIRILNRYPTDRVLYVCDHHPENHCSFQSQGGPWPAHCVMQTRGGAIHDDFYTKVEREDHRPSKENTFFKGVNPKREQYSGFESHNAEGIELNNFLTKNVLVSGIATEYCVRETCFDLVKSGHNVFLLEKGLAYIDKEGHNRTLAELARIGVKIV
ncbi:MAG: isochorismatase family protein, partial [Bacteroidales bacterium]|nr:isochorismatase family protein [Bacteroidales bacterium]